MLLNTFGPEAVLDLAEAGADDFIGLDQLDHPLLIAKLRAQLGRGPYGDEPRVHDTPARDPTIEINPNAFTVRVGDQQLQLSASQFRLLQLLIEKRGAVCDMSMISRALTGRSDGLSPAGLRSQVYLLRQALGPASHRLETVRKAGYRFKVP